MDFNLKLIKGEIVRLYHTLIVDIKLASGEIVQAFCAASTSEELYTTGIEAYISRRNNNLYEIKYDLQLINRGDGLVFVNPFYNNQIFEEAFAQGKISDLIMYNNCRCIEDDEKLPHVNYELSNEKGDKCYVTIENVYNKANGYSVFPARINFFELDMFEEFAKLYALGHRTMVFMIVPRMDCVEAKFSWNLDPVGAAKIYDAAKNGLEFVCYGCIVDKESISISNKMNILY